MTELRRVVDLLRQGRETRLRDLAPAASSAPAGVDAIGMTFRPGDRVFDRVTGEQGVVLGGERQHVINPATE